MIKCKPMKSKLQKCVELSNGCHHWTGCVDKDGYGRIRGTVNNVPYFVFAHRAAYGEYVAPIPKGLLVLHKCNNPSCINPNHLYVGTVAQNIADACCKPQGFYRTEETRRKASSNRSKLNHSNPQPRNSGDGKFTARKAR
jgi:hypothetical protein